MHSLPCHILPHLATSCYILPRLAAIFRTSCISSFMSFQNSQVAVTESEVRQQNDEVLIFKETRKKSLDQVLFISIDSLEMK